jgi:hypothetical protein
VNIIDYEYVYIDDTKCVVQSYSPNDYVSLWLLGNKSITIDFWTNIIDYSSNRDNIDVKKITENIDIEDIKKQLKKLFPKDHRIKKRERKNKIYWA